MSASIKIKILRSLKSNPVLFSTIWKLREHKSFLRHAVRKNDELVIEGFPRCGNTFATQAFLYAQKRPVRVANHFHAPAQIIGAAKWRIPAILLIRKPEDAVLSLAVYRDSHNLRTIIEDYIWFYRSLMPVIDWPVIADFSVITTDMGKVIYAVNDKYNTHYLTFNHTPQAESEVITHIEQTRMLRSARDPESSEMRSTTPSTKKNKLKNSLKDFLNKNADNMSLLREADALYIKITQHPNALKIYE